MACPDGLTPGIGLDNINSAAICCIKSSFGIGSDGLIHYRSGSGMLFNSGPIARHVVTAAHNIFDHETGRMADWITCYFQRIGDDSLAKRSAQPSDPLTAMFVPDDFRAAAAAPADFDFGLIRIKPLGIDRFTGITLGISTATEPSAKLLVGYPDGPEGDPCAGRYMPYHASLRVRPSSGSNYSYDNFVTYEGMSGGPLLSREPATNALRSFGVHIRGGNTESSRAVRFSPPIHAMIMGWT